MGCDELDQEGRLITLEYAPFYLVTCYTPPTLRRGSNGWITAWPGTRPFGKKLSALAARKPVVACGDLNVAHQEIDLKNPGSNRGNAGFSDEERESFTRLLNAGFTDTFRYLYPRCHRGVQLVELPFSSEETQRRLAN